MAQYSFSNSLLNGFQDMNRTVTPPDSPPSAMTDPFKDPTIMSRTTASGFTDNDIGNEAQFYHDEFDEIKEEAFRKVQELNDINHRNCKPKERLPGLLEKQEEIRELNNRMMKIAEKIVPLSRQVELENIYLASGMKKKTDRELNQELEDDIVSTLSKSTIRPNDSASILKPAKPGTRLTMYSGIRSSVIRSSEHDDVVGGYELTSEDKLIEQDAINNIQKVYGLPRIFVDNRLNFLVHLHKPLQAMLTTKTDSKVSYPDPNSLEKLTRFIDKSKGRYREPHAEILYQVLKSTIDLRRKRIKANPFNLPIVEIGMPLDDQLVFMCISELYAEFRTTWFHAMKNVEPPHFATDYVGVCSPTSYKKAGKTTHSDRKKRRGSSSILGSILSA